MVSASASVLVGPRVRLSAGSYQDLVNWYCSLLTRRTVCGRAAGNALRTQKQPEWKSVNAEIVRNSVLALQDHCSYKAPTTNHHIKQTFDQLRCCVCFRVSLLACSAPYSQASARQQVWRKLPTATSKRISAAALTSVLHYSKQMQTASARTEHRRWATIILQGGSRSGEVWRLLVRKLTRTLISHDRKYSRTHYTCTVPFAFHCNFTSWQHKKSAAQDCNNALVHIVYISNSFQQAQFSDIAIQ